MDGCDSVDIAEDINTLLAQYTDKDVRAVWEYGKYRIYTKNKYKDRFTPTGDYILKAVAR